tara:strand:+ start:71511 stop:71891 length:381 start_codon:yes stop_codon:yes gene_type:complete
MSPLEKYAAKKLLITKLASNALRLGKKKAVRVMEAITKRSKSVKETREAMPTAMRKVLGKEKIVKNLAELPREVARTARKIENKLGPNKGLEYAFAQLAKGTKHPSFRGKAKSGPDWNKRPKKRSV